MSHKPLFDVLESTCGGERPTLEEIDDAIERCDLPADDEMDVRCKLMAYGSLLYLLKSTCDGERPTLEQIEDAMDECDFPDDYELDVDELILDLSCYEIDHLERQLENERKRCDKLERKAKRL